MTGKLMDSINELALSIDDNLREITDISSNDEILDRVDAVSTAVSDIMDICRDDRDNWQPLIEVIPNPAQMSAGEMESLLELLREWRKANGYPVTYSCY